MSEKKFIFISLIINVLQIILKISEKKPPKNLHSIIQVCIFELYLKTHIIKQL